MSLLHKYILALVPLLLIVSVLNFMNIDRRLTRIEQLLSAQSK